MSNIPSNTLEPDEQYCCIVYDLSYFFNTLLNKAKQKYALTDKEFQIIQEVINGKSNEGIASQLYISIPTVKKHLASIYNKMEIKSQKQIIVTLKIK